MLSLLKYSLKEDKKMKKTPDIIFNPKNWTLTTQILAVLLIAVIFITTAMDAAVRYNFNRGFHDYIDKRDDQTIRMWKHSLESIYRVYGNWDLLKEDQGEWWKIITLNRPRFEERDDFFTEEHALKKLPPMHEEKLRPMPPPIGLLDANRNAIAGRFPAEENSVYHMLSVNNEIVGWLVTGKPGDEIVDAVDKQFLSSQVNDMFWIAIIGSGIASILVILIARRALRPIKKLAQATHDLSNGNYKARVEVNRHDEIGQLAEDFNKMAEAVEKNEKDRRSMMADISHELRTPITILQGEIESILDGVKEPDEEALQSLLDEINSLNYLVNDVHDIAVSDAGGWSYTETEVVLEEMIYEIAALYEEKLEDKNIELILESNNQNKIKGDKYRLTQLIKNLFENTLRYTDDDGILKITLQNNENNSVIVFEDSKPGVDKDLLDKLFERFFRVEGSRNRAYGGSGLGLSLCKNIVEHHKGTISATQSSLGGLKITIVLPKKQEGEI